MSATERVVTSEDISRVLSQRFTNEWNGQKRKIPFCEVLHRRGSFYNISDGFFFSQEEYGDNLSLASLGIVELVDHLNDHVEILNSDFDRMKDVLEQQVANPMTRIDAEIRRVRVGCEVLAYLLKVIMDKTLVLFSYAYNEYEIDSIGALLYGNRIENFCDGVFVKHKKDLSELNGLHNAYKHTFSNLQLTRIIPQIEPVMFAIYKPHNSTKVPTQIYHIICSNALDQFSSFMQTARDYNRRV